MKTKNAVVLVTGANRGLGRALVDAALERGARRVYAAARDPRTLAALVAQAGERVVPLALDVTDGRSVQAAAAQAMDVTMLINNAGVLASYDVLTSTPEQLQQDFATNAFGMLSTTKALLPALQRAEHAAIVNVLSVVSIASMPAIGGYSSAKAAAYSITQALRGALAKDGRIDVHAVLPGPIDTDMIRAMEGAKTSPADVAQAILDGVEQGLEEILPDPASREMFAMWRRDPRALQRQLASM